MPAEPLSPPIIQLLERLADGKLLVVLDKSSKSVIRDVSPIFLAGYLVTYNHWILHLTDGLKTLHSLGTVRCDLRANNIVFCRTTYAWSSSTSRAAAGT